MDNKKRNVATKTLLVLSCAFLLGLTSCTKRGGTSSDTSSNTPISDTTSESTSENTSNVTTSEEQTSDPATSEEPSSEVSSEESSSEEPSSDVSSEDTSSEESSSEEVLLDFDENVKLSDKTVTYNGEEQTLTVENLPEGATVAYEGTHKFTNAGEYTISATVSKEGYNDKVVSAKLTIAKAKVEVPTAKTNLVYTGESLVGVEANSLYTVTGGSAVEAGTHEATITLKDAANYEWEDADFDGKVSYTIAQAEIDVSNVSANEMSVVDTGNAINFVVNDVPTNVKATVTYYSDETRTTPVSEAKGVGVYFVKVELAPTSTNYKLVGETTLTSKLTIRENNTGVTFAGATFDYDGTEKTIAVDMSNAKADGDFEVTYFANEECTETFTTATNAGTYHVYAKVVDKNQVYSETVLPATLTINKVAVKVVVADKEITYNQDAPTFTYEVQRLVNGESAENVITGNATFTCDYVKGSIAGTYDIVLSGLAAENYELVYYKGTLTVTKVKVSVPEAKDGLVYNGTAQVAVEENELYTVTDGSATNAGQYSATVTLKDTTNYEWANAEFNGEVQYEIAKADLDVSNIAVEGLGEENATTYNGEAKVVTVTGLPEGLVSASVKYYADAEHTAEIVDGCKNAGTYYVVVTFTQEDIDNYNVSTIEPVSGELVIKQKVLSVTWEGETEYTYDGTEKDIPTCTINEGQVITGDEVNLLVMGEPTIKFVGEYGWKLALDGAQASNYEIDIENGTYLVSILPPKQNMLVNDWSSLEEGDYALVVSNSGTYYALTNNLGSTSATIKINDCASFTTFEGLVFESTSIWHISKEGDGYYISVGDKYLSYSSSSDTKLKLADSSSATLWSIGSNERGYYFYDDERALLFNVSGEAIGYYSNSNLTSKSYGFVSLYKIEDAQSYDFTVEDLNVENCEFNVVSTTERLVGLYGSVDTLNITVKVPDGKILTSLTVRDADNNVLETLAVNETTVGTDTVYTYSSVPTHSGKIVAEVGEALPFTVSQTAHSAVTVNTTLPVDFYANTKVELNITVSEEYKLVNVIATGTSGVTYTVNHEEGTNNYSFTMPKENVNISYELEEKMKVTITEGNATITIIDDNDGAISNGGYIEKGSTFTVTAKAKPGYTVTNINVTGATYSEETGKYTVEGEVTVSTETAEISLSTIAELKTLIDGLDDNTFSANPVKVSGLVTKQSYNSNYKSYTTVITDGTNEFTIYSGALSSSVDSINVGDTVTATGYCYKYVNSNTGVITYELSGSNAVDYPTYLSVVHNEYAITSSVVDGEGNASTNATISGLPESGKANSGETVSFTVTPSSGYKIANVKVNDEEIAEVKGNYSFVVNGTSQIVISIVSSDVKLETVVYSTGFETSEGFATSSTYNSSTFKVCGNSDKGSEWKVKMGTPTSTGSISGVSLQMRCYSGNSNYGVFQSTKAFSNITKISFKANYYTVAANLYVYVSSTGEDDSWVKKDSITLETSTKEYTVVLSETGKNLFIRFEVSYSSAPTATGRVTIDDLTLMGYTD